MRVASRLSGMHPQTLRKYERVGLLAPTRLGALRMYSDEDIALLKMIKYLIGNLGLNIAGVELAMTMRSGLKSLKRQAEALPEESASRRSMDRTIDQMLRLIESPEAG
jgi:MerR family transcriptional regulator/heat shock protein HspR